MHIGTEDLKISAGETSFCFLQKADPRNKALCRLARRDSRRKFFRVVLKTISPAQGSIQTSKHLIHELRKGERKDLLMILGAFFFFFLSVIWVLKVRVLGNVGRIFGI